MIYIKAKCNNDRVTETEKEEMKVLYYFKVLIPYMKCYNITWKLNCDKIKIYTTNSKAIIKITKGYR